MTTDLKKTSRIVVNATKILHSFEPNLQEIYIFLVKKGFFWQSLGPFSFMAAKELIVGFKTVFFSKNLVIKGLEYPDSLICFYCFQSSHLIVRFDSTEKLNNKREK